MPRNNRRVRRVSIFAEIACGGEIGVDAHDTLTWVAEQPWSNGRVGMMGLSYLGAAQWLAVPDRNGAERQIARHEEGASLEEIFVEQVRAGERVRG